MVEQLLPDADVGGRHDVSVLGVPRPGGGGEDVVGSVGDQRGHRPLIPRVALRVATGGAHDQWGFLGGQRTTHLEVGDDPEVVHPPEQIQCGDPVLGVRAARQRNGSVGVRVAVGAVDEPGIGEVADALVDGGDGQVFLGLQHRRTHRQLGHPGVVDEGARARVVAGRQAGELFAVGAQHHDVLAPGERGRGQRHPQQRHRGAEHDRRAPQADPQRHRRRRADRRRRPAALTQRILDIAGRQPGQHAGDRQDGGSFGNVDPGLPGVDEVEDQQRPVPQIQRIRHRAQRHERLAGHQPVGCRHRAAGVRISIAVGRRQDEQQRRHHRDERPGAGELPHAVDQRPTRQDHRQRGHRHRDAQPHRAAQVRHDRPDEDTDEQLPGPGEAVVVRGGLIGVVRDDRVHERGDGQPGEQDDECRAHVAAEKTAKCEREHQDQGQERDVELPLHRHRPDVLQRADSLPGAQIVRGGVGQLPVLVIAQARQALVGERLPACLGLDQDRQYRGRGQHHDHGRQQSAHQPFDLRHRAKRRTRGQRTAQQPSPEEEARQDQEDVDSARHPPEPHVEHRDERDGDAAQPVEVMPVETGRAGAHAGARRGRRGRRRSARDGPRCRPGGGKGHHDRRLIYRRCVR